MYCCICGAKFESAAGSLLVNGQRTPICNSCADDLDALQGENAKKAQENLLEKMRYCGASASVENAVTSMFSKQSTSPVEKAKNPDITQEEGMHIKEYARKLGNVAILFCVIGVLGSLVGGISLLTNSHTEKLGIGVLVGGILFTLLLYYINMLLLETASAIGRMDKNIVSISKQLAQTNQPYQINQPQQSNQPNVTNSTNPAIASNPTNTVPQRHRTDRE